jgi:hypothetical protein
MSEELHDENLDKPAKNGTTNKKAKRRRPIPPPTFAREITTFISHITSLSVTLEVSMSAINQELKKISQQFTEFSNEKMTRVEKDGKKFHSISAESFYRLEELINKMRLYNLAIKNVPRSYIMALISQYDAFLGRLIRVTFLEKPELLNASERNLTFAQLVEFGSVDQAKEFILEKEVETLLRKSHTEQFEWLEKKLGINLRKDLAVWPDFIEVTERRNLFVHSGGVVSDQYLRTCKQHNLVLDNVKSGDELHVDQEYFQYAYNVIFEIGLKLGHVLWRKIKPDELEIADSNLMGIGFETLREERYHLSKTIYDFAILTLKKHSTKENYCLMLINRALAYKWSGDNTKAHEICNQEDWSAASARFKLAEAVILDKFDDAYSLMMKIGKNSEEVLKESYRVWPLFKAIKVESKFQEAFESIFGEPYNKIPNPPNLVAANAAVD